MEDEIVKIIIPSHKRADRVLTLKAINHASVCVPESQEAEYRKHNPDAEIITHPDSVIGLAPKRQWIIENYPNVLMLDDDIGALQRLYLQSKLERDEILTSRVDPETAYEIVQVTADVARKMGAYLFGFSFTVDFRDYHPRKPFDLQPYIGGHSIGLLEGHKLHFPTEEMCIEDFYVCLLNAYYHRYMFIETRFGFAQEKTFVNTGGLSDFRNIDLERKGFIFLRQKFGDAIQKKKPSIRGHRQAHPYGKTIKLPY